MALAYDPVGRFEDTALVKCQGNRVGITKLSYAHIDEQELTSEQTFFHESKRL